MSRFKKWMDLMGFNGKQISAAGETIGIKTYNTIKQRLIDKDDISKTELLAMAAIRAGLEPWSEEYDAELQTIDQLRQVVQKKNAA